MTQSSADAKEKPRFSDDSLRPSTSSRRVNADGHERWTAIYIDRDGRKRSAGAFDTRSEADAASAEACLTLRSITLEQYADTWFKRHPRKATTERIYTEKLRHAFAVEVEGRRAGDWPLTQWRRPQAERFVAELREKGHTPGNASTIIRPLSALLTDAANDGVAEYNPFQYVEFP